jgi:hypothetical protein
MGLSLNSKYYALTLAATCLIAALASSERRRYLRSASPYVSVSVALAMWAPHLYWLAATGAPPIRYLERVSGLTFAEAGFAAASAVIGSALQQILAIGAVAATRGRGERSLDVENRRLLFILSLAPVGLTVAAALALRTKISSNMLIGVFPLSPLAAIVWLRPDPAQLRLWALRGATFVSLGALALSPLIAVGKAWYGRDSEDWEPRREAALSATAFWRQATSAPLAFVAGSFRYDNATVFYSPDHPSAFVNFDYFGNRWASAEKLTARGLLTICREDDFVCRAKTAEFATPATRREEISLAHEAYGRKRAAVKFVVTAIPPR